MQTGETALKSLAKRFTGGDESQLIDDIYKAQLIIAMRRGDIAGVRRLVECPGVDVNGRDRVRCQGATFNILIHLMLIDTREE